MESDNTPIAPTEKRWSVPKIDKPYKVRGWLAGPAFRLDTHNLGQTKPCLDKLTKGKLFCRFCNGELPILKRAYLPLYALAGERWVFIINDLEWERVCGYPERSEVELRRNKEYHGALKIERIPDSQQNTVPKGLHELEDVDIFPFLVRLWKIPELTSEWERECREKLAAGETPVTSSEPKKRARKEPTVRFNAADGLPPLLTEDSKAALKRNKEFARMEELKALTRSKNGDGH